MNNSTPNNTLVAPDQKARMREKLVQGLKYKTYPYVRSLIIFWENGDQGFKEEGGGGVGDDRVHALKDSGNKKIACIVLRDNAAVSGLINPLLPFGAVVTGDRRIVFKYIKHED